MKDKKIEIIGLILTVLITIMVYRQAERFNNNDNERIGEILNKKELITPSEKWEFCNQLVNNSDNEDKGKILKLIIFSPIPEESKIELLKTCDFSELKFDWNEEDKNAYLNLKPNTKINIKKTLLKNSTFEDNDLSYFDLEKAILDNSNFINTNLTEANLKRASIRKCNFERANLIRTNFEYCDLRTLKNPFQNSFLWGIKLHNTKVSSTSWIDDICSNPNEDAIGSDYICKNYIIEEKERTDKFGKYHLIKWNGVKLSSSEYLKNAEYEPIEYNDGRLIFKIELPKNYFNSMFSGGSDGLQFYSFDGQVEMIIRGTNNYFGLDTEAVMEAEQDNGKVTYEQDNGFISGYRDAQQSRIFYKRIIAEETGDYSHTILEFEYPTTYKESFDETLTKIVKSFRVK